MGVPCHWSSQKQTLSETCRSERWHAKLSNTDPCPVMQMPVAVRCSCPVLLHGFGMTADLTGLIQVDHLLALQSL